MVLRKYQTVGHVFDDSLTFITLNVFSKVTFQRLFVSWDLLLTLPYISL